MTISEMIPSLDDAALANLRSNATRLEATGAGQKRQEAADLLPLIDAELAERASRKPAPKPRARKKAVVAAAPVVESV
jgi:hypothetical protein